MYNKPALQALENLEFSNRFTRQLPADPLTDNRPRQVSRALYSRVNPEPVAEPRLLAWSDDVAGLLAPDGALLRASRDTETLAQVFSGNLLTSAMEPHASRYGGHQFGHWAGQLGDGRAINLGEVKAASGHWTLQLKGAGLTPYSRGGDGRAVLRSSLREFLCSEAMHHLGVPTTRALSLVLTGEQVVRDMFYDGHPHPESGAIVCRASPSFIRFGNFEMLAASQELDLLEQLLDFVIRCDRPDLAKKLDLTTSLAGKRDIYLSWFQTVCDLTQNLMVEWRRVGFVHGVMNTDNMSVLGLTLDYGPYGWVDDYDPDWTPNTTDAGQRRYRFGQQPAVARWNLFQLANAIYPLMGDAQPLKNILEGLPAQYERLERRMLCNKLGLEGTEEGMGQLLEKLEVLLQHRPTDMTLFFRGLAGFDAESHSGSLYDCIRGSFYSAADDKASASLYQAFEDHYRQLLRQRSDEPARQARMQRANPAFVLRNYIAQQIIDDLEGGGDGQLREAMRLIKSPYEIIETDYPHWYVKRPEWALNRPGCSMLSCSS